MSKIRYCINVWGAGAPKYLSDRICVLQKRAVRIVCNLPYDFPTGNAFAENGFLNIEQLVFYSNSVFMYKTLNGLTPAYLKELFQILPESSLRSSAMGNLILPKISMESGRKAFRYSGANTCNSLPPDIRNAPSLHVMKLLLKDYLFSK